MTKRIGIACQGGGSHTSFTAGVLKGLFEAKVDEHYQIVSLSGTSGGGICAAAAWKGLLHKAAGSQRPPYEGLIEFWRDNTAQHWIEQWQNALFISITRAQVSGFLPTLVTSPYNQHVLQLIAENTALRREFVDFRTLLEKHFDFTVLDTLCTADRPALLLGAVNVLSGEFEAFDSRKGEISIEALMATGGLPTLFEAIEIEGHYYWDGLYSQNPPIWDMITTPYDQRPQEIWIILINAPEVDELPRSVAKIAERRNALTANLSLYQELAHIDRVNNWIRAGVFNPDHPARPEPIEYRIISMSPELGAQLDYPSKLDRSPAVMDMLIADGEKQARHFLQTLPDLATS